MSRKIALVTGGTSGVGLSLLPELVRRGFIVHFVGRNADKGREIEARLNAEHGDVGHGDIATFVQLDLGDLAAVKTFAVEFQQRVPALDLLANVAGSMQPQRQVTREGFEKTFAVGYLSAFVLCTHLAPSLAKATSGRIINVAGSPRFVLKPSLDLDDLGFKKNYNGIRAAIKTIHAKSVLTEILAERLAEQGTSVNSFHPGAVKGNLGRNTARPLQALFGVANLFLSKTSKTALYVATSVDVDGVTGHYFVGHKGRALAFESEYKDGLWQRTLEMLA